MSQHSLERGHAPLNRFTHREMEVLELASRGMTNSEIAGGPGLTVHAIKFHLASVYRKLGVANRTEAAVAYALNVTSRPQNGHP